LKELETILQDADAGDPITGLKWTRKTTRGLAKELQKKKYQVGHSTIPRLAKELGYTLKKNPRSVSPRIVLTHRRFAGECLPLDAPE
jgi:transposase